MQSQRNGTTEAYRGYIYLVAALCGTPVNTHTFWIVICCLQGIKESITLKEIERNFTEFLLV